jgi:hypothetical protein
MSARVSTRKSNRERTCPTAFPYPSNSDVYLVAIATPRSAPIYTQADRISTETLFNQCLLKSAESPPTCPLSLMSLYFNLQLEVTSLLDYFLNFNSRNNSLSGLESNEVVHAWYWFLCNSVYICKRKSKAIHVTGRRGL